MRTPLLLLVAFAFAPPPSPPPAVKPAAPARKPVARPAAPPPMLQGVVKGPDGKPIEKALVVVRPLTIGLAGDPPLTARTDAVGLFGITLETAGMVSVRVEARGLAAQTMARVRPGTPLAITLQKGGVIEGVVRDGGTGQPVPEARVEAHAEGSPFAPVWEVGAGMVEAVTDAKGAYRLEGLAASAYAIGAAARGFGRAELSSVTIGRRVELFLFPGGMVRGVVRGPADEPLAGVLVRAEGGTRFRAAPMARPTDAAGRFEIVGLEPGVYRLIAHHRDWAVGVADVVLERPGEIAIDLRLERGLKVTGRLVDALERPVVGRVVMAEIAERLAGSIAELLRAEAGADGRFRLDRIPGGEHALLAEARGFANKRVEVEARMGAVTLELGDIVLETGNAIRGQVKDKAGLGIGGARIRARSLGGRMGGFTQTTCDDEGMFALAGLQAGSYRVTATAPGFAMAMKTVMTGTDAFELVLEQAGVIMGVVADDAGRPVEGFRAEATTTRREGFMMRGPGGDADVSGDRFTLNDLAAGDYVVQVTAPDKGTGVVSDVKVAAGAITDVGRVVIKAGGVVRGQVVDASGAGVPGATVSIESAGGSFPRAYRPAGMTDGAGGFEIRGVPPGPASARAAHPNFTEGVASDLEVDTGRPAEARIVLTQGGRIEGFARQRGNVPIPDGYVQAILMTRGRISPIGDSIAATGPDGSFSVDHVPAGRVNVTLMTRGGSATYTNRLSREVEVQEGQTTTVEFVLREILLSGRLTRAGAPLPGVRLHLSGENSMSMRFGPGAADAAASSGGPQRMTAVSREDGAYALLVDEPGEYQVSFDPADGRSLPMRSVTVPDADALAFDFAFAGITLAGTVVDKDSEQPIGEASVSASPKEGGSPSGWTGATTGPDGRFQMEVQAAEYRIAVRAPGYIRTTQEVTVGTAGAPEVRMALSRGVSLRGRILDPRGRPVGGVAVRGIASDAVRTAGFAGSLPDGTFTIEGLEQQSYVLVAGSEDFGFGVVGPVAPGDGDILVRLKAPGRVRVTVLGPDGAPVQGLTPNATVVDGLRFGGAGVPSPTDQAGVTDVVTPAGNLLIEARTERLQGTATVTVPEGGTAAVEIRLAERPPANSP